MNVKQRLFTVATVVALAAAGILMSGGREAAKASPGAAPVSIVSPLPLPTTGTATVSGTVGATQSGPWSVSVANSPAVTLAGTPTVNANVTFPANQGVTVAAAGPLTNVGRLPSKQVELISVGPQWCPSLWTQGFADGSIGAPNSSGCFDMANHSGEVLVITDFSWFASTNPGATCFLELGNFMSSAVGASDGHAAKSEHFTTGIPLTVNPQASVGPSPCNLGNLWTITGYLMPNQ
jgi:hypothetical protein